jgi:RNA polymerase sigma-70 factor, ECF subfamily
MSNPLRDANASSDRELVARATADPDSPDARQAAGTLLRRYRRTVYAWCFRYVREHERALDMSQDVLLSAYRRLGEFEGRAAFSSWLFVIARNRCLNEMRNDARRETIDVDTMIDDGAAFDERIDIEMQGRKVLDVAARVLDATEQKALWLRYSERLPVEEITAMLGLDRRSGARAVLQRARRKLRNALEGG